MKTFIILIIIPLIHIVLCIPNRQEKFLSMFSIVSFQVCSRLTYHKISWFIFCEGLLSILILTLISSLFFQNTICNGTSTQKYDNPNCVPQGWLKCNWYIYIYIFIHWFLSMNYWFYTYTYFFFLRTLLLKSRMWWQVRPKWKL